MGIPTQASFAKPGPSKLSSTMTASNASSDSDAQSNASRPPAAPPCPSWQAARARLCPNHRPDRATSGSRVRRSWLSRQKADLGAGSDFDMAAFDDFTFDLSSAGGGSGTIGGGGITPGLQAMQGLWGIGSVSEMSGGKA